MFTHASATRIKTRISGLPMVGSKRKGYGDFTQESLSSAVQSVKEGMKIREAANLYGIPKSTLHRN